MTWIWRIQRWWTKFFFWAATFISGANLRTRRYAYADVCWSMLTYAMSRNFHFLAEVCAQAGMPTRHVTCPLSLWLSLSHLVCVCVCVCVCVVCVRVPVCRSLLYYYYYCYYFLCLSLKYTSNYDQVWERSGWWQLILPNSAASSRFS